VKPEFVEIKVTVSRDQVEHAKDLLKSAERKSELRAIYFFDGEGLQERGLIIRGRLDSEEAEATVKLRLPEITDDLAIFADGGGFKLEGDWVGERRSLSASIDNDEDAATLTNVATGQEKLGKLLNKTQEKFIEQFGPGVNLDSLKPLGPILAHRYNDIKELFELPLVVESWYLPEPLSELLEISLRAAYDQAEKTQKAFERWLEENGLDGRGQPGTKTQRVMELLARRPIHA